LEALLAAVTKAVFTQLAVRLSSRLLDPDRALRWLGRDAQRLAFKAALAHALIDLRAEHPDAEAIFFDEVFLASVPVASILAGCLPPGEPPPADALAAACAAQLGSGPPDDRRVEQALAAAAYFLERLRAHLRVQEPFRPLFDSASGDAAAASLRQIADRLEALPQILERVERPRPRLKRYVIPSAARVRRWTEGFVGRDFVFDSLDDRLLDLAFPGGYVLLRGEPGIGKTAIAAELIRSRNYVHHFNVATGNIRTAREFLPNACAQLIERYGLPYEELPPHAEVGSALLSALLAEAVEVAEADGDAPVVLVVDALDEAETPAPGSGVNRLALPYDLPDGAYVIATIRAGVDAVLDVARQAEDVVLDEQDPDNLADVEAYIRAFLEGHAAVMDGRLREFGVDAGAFVEKVAGASEGNFMYLVHVLPDIAGGRIRPEDIEGRLENLPGGLDRYYERHWRTMKDGDREAFRRRQQPVICMLAVAREPVTAAKVAEWINANDTFGPVDVDEVEDVFEDWIQFLNPEPGDPQCYRLYHASFLDFLERKVGLERYRAAASAALAAKTDW
jgi:hypothetical protein